MAEYKPLQQLSPAQAEASTPHKNVWLTASAGTGKTQVLSARVLRLLLNGVKPESILCLTFTKAGAAEMADRVHKRLAAWVRAPEKLIMRDLFNLGEANGPDEVERARTLFAKVLDARGGGLRIQTIHSFCQTLLSGFPAEAGLPPGFRPMEEAESRQLAETVLADLISHAISGGDTAFITRFQDLALLKGENDTRSYLSACARAHRALAAMGAGIEAKVRTGLGLPLADVALLILTGCSDGGFDRAGLDAIAQANANWRTATGLKRADAIGDWLRRDPAARMATLLDLTQVWTKSDGERRIIEKNLEKASPEYAELTARAHDHFNGFLELQRLDILATQISNALIVGQKYAIAYAEAKRKAGGVDFDDLIHTTARLLREPGMGEWIRYKLDQSTDHILVDEAQDTNDDQWGIIKALAEEFYAGAGAKSGTSRTIFTVGDTKQAIFGFQGTDPRAMMSARDWFERQTQGVGLNLLTLNLAQSYRSSPPILELVDAVIAEVGAEKMGLGQEEVRHRAALGSAGQIMLLPPIFADEGSAAIDEDAEGWITPGAHQLARSIARQVADALDGGMWIEDRAKGSTRPLEPKDVMILLRARGELAQLIVARLHEAKVPVAGIDRLQLHTPLVVRDVMAAIRFALQPLDDLNLACLLRSPLLGWSEEELQRVCIGREKGALWPYLRKVASGNKEIAPHISVRPELVEGLSFTSTASQESTVLRQAQDERIFSFSTLHSDRLKPLYDLLNMGDRFGPARFIEMLLSGPLSGRRRLLKRFGEEARDPLEELMNAALAFERLEVPALQGFLRWFERGDIDIKRDAVANSNAVRVLTVHGAKGLQAPFVILADATKKPGGGRERSMDWAYDLGDARKVPIPRPPAAQRVGSIMQSAEDASARELEEHWRLLYVALTRAEERLLIAGSLGKSTQAVPEDSWHAAVEQALMAIGGVKDDDGVVVYGEGAEPTLSVPPEPAEAHPKALHIANRPSWLDALAPQEARPPRPLSPSALTEDTSANPPPNALMQAAAERGRLLHALFERLPGVALDLRVVAADQWLSQAAGVGDANTRAALIADALKVIEDLAFADVFSPKALAEAPVAGVVDGIVIAGTVDRLLVTDTTVTVIDFKTARRVPHDSGAAPESHLRQMAAYVAVLQGIFPAHDVRAALLYTSGPILLTLDPALMAQHKPSFQLEQHILGVSA